MPPFLLPPSPPHHNLPVLYRRAVPLLPPIRKQKTCLFKEARRRLGGFRRARSRVGATASGFFVPSRSALCTLSNASSLLLLRRHRARSHTLSEHTQTRARPSSDDDARNHPPNIKRGFRVFHRPQPNPPRPGARPSHHGLLVRHVHLLPHPGRGDRVDQQVGQAAEQGVRSLALLSCSGPANARPLTPPPLQPNPHLQQQTQAPAPARHHGGGTVLASVSLRREQEVSPMRADADADAPRRRRRILILTRFQAPASPPLSRLPNTKKQVGDHVHGADAPAGPARKSGALTGPRERAGVVARGDGKRARRAPPPKQQTNEPCFLGFFKSETND